MKKVLIIGAGLTGCVLARLLAERFKEIKIEVFEKNKTIGGLCETNVMFGNVYQVHGPHQFHTKHKNVIDFIKKFETWDNYTHYKGAFFEKENRYVSMPLNYKTIDTFLEKDLVLTQLASLPKIHRTDTFENATKDIVGSYLYEHFFEGYSKKLWREPLNKLTGEWVSKRIKIADNEESYFNGETQLMPRYGFNRFFENLLDHENITTQINEEYYGNIFNAKYDWIFSSMPIDQLFNYKYGQLKYVGIKNVIKLEKEWGFTWANINYSSNNIPYIRKTNYNKIYKKNTGVNLIGYEYPCEHAKMYPVKTQEFQTMLLLYNEELKKFPHIKSVGRLGQFKYINMDECIKSCFDEIENIV